MLRILQAKTKQLALALIKVYRYAISPMLGQHCRYYPSCSGYAYLAIERFGLLRGVWLAVRRLLRCHPWHEGGYDPVPESSTAQHPHPHGHQCQSHEHDLDKHLNH